LSTGPFSPDGSGDRPRVYLAGPEVFLPDAVEIGRHKQVLCEAYGLVGLFPLDNDIAAAGAELPVDRAIFRLNVAMMRRADAGIFNLSPFRGIGADAGTVFELGLMQGLGKAVFGYTNAAGTLLARTPGVRRDAQGVWRDGDGMMVEDFGNADNLMLDSCLADAGAPMVRAARTCGLADLAGFEACLRLAAARLRA
jgi:nucleoside 2-deoxyribosyltransferase